MKRELTIHSETLRQIVLLDEELTRKSSSSPERRKMIARAMARNSLDQLAGKPFTKCPLLILPTAMPVSIMPSGPGNPTCVTGEVL